MSGLFLMVDEKGNPISTDSSEALRMALTGAIKDQADDMLAASKYNEAVEAGTTSKPHVFDFTEKTARE